MDESIRLSLQESYCLPTISYASAAIPLNLASYQNLTFVGILFFREIFHFNRLESVRLLIYGFGR